ncbi:MAG: hypothetical protein ACLFPE_13910 [Bacteroidales bacterium]
MKNTRKRSRLLKPLAFLIILFGLMGFVMFSNQMLRILFHQKIWAHRANSTDKLGMARQKFPGVELDVVFMEGQGHFDVHHPPEPPSGLTLAQYFTAAGEFPLQFWLDFKNLNSRNRDAAVQHLKDLARQFNIEKKRIIVEADHPGHLRAFSTEGFLTSWYLPQGLSLLKQNELEPVAGQIGNSLENFPVDFISTEFKDYPVLNQYFPNQKKLFWFTVYGSVNKIRARLLLYEILTDENTEVLLMPF